jgi:hypothetical protein
VKLLLDEHIDVDFRHELAGHDVSTVTYLKWNGMKNGVLLAQAAAHGFEAIITTDVMDVRSNDVDDLRPLVPHLLIALASLQPCSLVHVA